MSNEIEQIESIVGKELQALIDDALFGGTMARIILKNRFPQTYALMAFAYDWEEEEHEHEQ